METIYHGSENIIQRPEYGKGKTYNDYGLGFYCTRNPSMAKEWAVAPFRDGYANCYAIHCEGMRILDLSAPQYTTLHWLGVLLENRTFDMQSGLALEAKDYITSRFHVDYRDADIIIGCRADDSYFSYAQDFINGAISSRQLSSAMKLGKLGLQFVLKSRKAFEAVSFEGAEKVSAGEWYRKREFRDKTARSDYFDMKNSARRRGDIYITAILDEEMTPDDIRLR